MGEEEGWVEEERFWVNGRRRFWEIKVRLRRIIIKISY